MEYLNRERSEARNPTRGRIAKTRDSERLLLLLLRSAIREGERGESEKTLAVEFRYIVMKKRDGKEGVVWCGDEIRVMKKTKVTWNVMDRVIGRGERKDQKGHRTETEKEGRDE